jgi:pilus assembly protein CpaC
MCKKNLKHKVMHASGLAFLACLLLGCVPGIRAQRPVSPAVKANVSLRAGAPQGNPPAAPTSPTPVTAEPPQTSEVPQELHLLVGRSLVITSPTRIKRISLADPAIAEAIAVTPNQILVNGKAPGGVSLLLWDEQDQSQVFEVSVDIDVLSLTEKIHQVFPDEQVQVETSKDSVMLSGRVSSAAVADKILEVVKNATPKVTSLMQVPPVVPGQVLLEVKFAEVDRSALTQLGINLLALPGGKNVLTTSTQQFAPPGLTGNLGSSSSGSATATPPAFGLSDLLNVFFFRPDINLAATIKALQTQNVLQILAEPNLLTASGKDASFLAGGEFPFPVIQGTGQAGSFPTVTIQFKEFGVRLNFTPTIMPDGLIHLKVAPEVSSLDFANALTISGFTIPALSTRRILSEMDLRDGQSFAIAGLVDNTLTTTFDRVPWLSDIPVLGTFFKSKSVNKSKTELLVVVTPRVVQPLTPDQIPPGPTFPGTFLGDEKPSQSHSASTK